MQYIAKDKAGFTEIITTDDCEKHLYLPDDADLTLLPHYILTARRWIENYCNVPLVTKTVNVHHDTFPINREKLLLPLITEESAVASISYYDEDDAAQTFTVSDTILANIPVPNYLIPKKDWPAGAKNVKITYEATAYYDRNAFKSPVLLLVAHQFENRDIIEDKFSNSLRSILAPLRLKYHP